MNLTDDSNVPGVVFSIPPPDQEALDSVDRLRRAYDRSTALWQRKQLRMRQNMIFATIKVVKGWDLAQVIEYKYTNMHILCFILLLNLHYFYFYSFWPWVLINVMLFVRH